MKTKLLCLITILTLLTATLTGCGTPDLSSDSAGTTSATSGTNASEASGTDTSEAETQIPEISGKYYAEIEIKDYGTIKVTLDADTAPITVANFVKLANEGFYNGLTFHRIISGFMIQGGAPSVNSTGSSIEPIKGEFSANGVENSIAHVRGVISMARSSNYNSATSQFFIMHEDSPHLDGQYAAFGFVTEGIEIVDAICNDTKVEDFNGTVLPENQPVIVSVKIVAAKEAEPEESDNN